MMNKHEMTKRHPSANDNLNRLVKALNLSRVNAAFSLTSISFQIHITSRTLKPPEGREAIHGHESYGHPKPP